MLEKSTKKIIEDLNEQLRLDDKKVILSENKCRSVYRLATDKIRMGTHCLVLPLFTLTLALRFIFRMWTDFGLRLLTSSGLCWRTITTSLFYWKRVWLVHSTTKDCSMQGILFSDVWW
jgi:hypothetical protein